MEVVQNAAADAEIARRYAEWPPGAGGMPPPEVEPEPTRTT